MVRELVTVQGLLQCIVCGSVIPYHSYTFAREDIYL